MSTLSMFPSWKSILTYQHLQNSSFWIWIQWVLLCNEISFRRIAPQNYIYIVNFIHRIILNVIFCLILSNFIIILIFLLSLFFQHFNYPVVFSYSPSQSNDYNLNWINIQYSLIISTNIGCINYMSYSLVIVMVYAKCVFLK